MDAAFSPNLIKNKKNGKQKRSSYLTMSAVSKLGKAVGKLAPSSTTFFLCDIQERFRPLIYNGETIVSTAKYLTSTATELDIPIIATQQYTKVFGPTVTDCFANGQEGIDDLLAKNRVFEKKMFSMMTDEVTERIQNDDELKDRSSVVLFGIEAHVCVQQTCLDLLEMGKEVHIVCDGVSSQQPYDRDIALKRMSEAGAFLTTAQSLAFMLMQCELSSSFSFYGFLGFCISLHVLSFDSNSLTEYLTGFDLNLKSSAADHSNFKAVSKLTVNHMKLPNDFNDAYEK